MRGCERPLRLTLVSASLDIGGAELQLLQLAIGLVGQGCEVIVLGLQGGPYAEELRRAGVRVELIPTGLLASPTAFLKLMRAIRRSKPDLVHTQAFRANLWGRLAAILLKVPVVASCRGPFRRRSRVHLAVERWLARRTRAIITPSQATSEYLTALDITGAPHVVIPNGVATQRASRESGDHEKAIWRGDASYVVAIVARLRPEKNVGLLIEAFSQLSRTEEARLIIVGDGPEEETLRACARPLADRILFAGTLGRDGVAQVLDACDVLCLTSDYEGLPNALLEGMAAGRAVVATNVGGVGELLNCGSAGILVPPRDARALRAALECLYQDADLRHRLASAARAQIGRRYTVEANVELHLELYMSLLDRRERPRGRAAIP